VAVKKPEEETGQSQDLKWLREAQRGMMVRTLNRLMRMAKKESRRKDVPSGVRLKWANALCYMVQTCNAVLRDTDYDELNQEVSGLLDKVEKLSEKGDRQAQTGNQTVRIPSGQSSDTG
jgi:hypothetical protein